MILNCTSLIHNDDESLDIIDIMILTQVIYWTQNDLGINLCNFPLFDSSNALAT